MDGVYDRGQWTGKWPGEPPQMPPEAPQEQEELRTTRKRFSWLGWAFLIGALVMQGAQVAVMLGLQALKPELMLNSDVMLLASMLPMYLVGMPVLIFLVKRLPAAPMERHSIRPGAFVAATVMCFGLVYLSNILGTLITTAVSILKRSVVQNEIFNVTSAVSMWSILLYMVICAPLMEEYVFRKLIVERTVRYGQGVAVLVSGLMFGLFHGNLNQFAYAFTLGVFLAFLYVKTGNLKITIALHMMINFMGGFVSSLLFKMIDIEEYMDLALRGNQKAMMEFLMENLLGVVLYMMLGVFVIGVVIAGAVLWIVSLVKKKFTFAQGMIVIPRGKKFTTVMLNGGMIFYCIFWIGMILWQLLW